MPRVPFAVSSRSQLLQRNWLELTLARPGRGSQPLSTGSGRQRSPHDLLDVRSPQGVVKVSQRSPQGSGFYLELCRCSKFC